MIQLYMGYIILLYSLYPDENKTDKIYNVCNRNVYINYLSNVTNQIFLFFKV